MICLNSILLNDTFKIFFLHIVMKYILTSHLPPYMLWFLTFHSKQTPWLKLETYGWLLYLGQDHVTRYEKNWSCTAVWNKCKKCMTERWLLTLKDLLHSKENRVCYPLASSGPQRLTLNGKSRVSSWGSNGKTFHH